MPAPTKFTPETRATILQFIRNACSRQQACAAAGITRKTLNAWEKEAAESPDSEMAAFIEEMQLAQDYSEAKLAVIHNALATGTKLEMEGMNLEKVNLRALEFQLQFAGTRPWADVRAVEVTGKDGGPLEIADKASERIGAVLMKMADRIKLSGAVAIAGALDEPKPPPA